MAFVQTREQKPRSFPSLSVNRTHLPSTHSGLEVQSAPNAFVPVPPLELDVELDEEDVDDVDEPVVAEPDELELDGAGCPLPSSLLQAAIDADTTQARANEKRRTVIRRAPWASSGADITLQCKVVWFP